MTELIFFLNYMVIIVATPSFLVALSNFRFVSSLDKINGQIPANPSKRTVSVLIPARNEEYNIAFCLRALIAQKYESMEILVLDDQSTDRTNQVVQDIARSDMRVKMLSGSELPRGWIGKNWACHQLSREAKGEFFLFVDADTILGDGAVFSAVMNSISSSVDLLTVMPKRIAGCIVEKLIFPFIDWASFCWIPMKRAHRSRNARLSATFGQFMLFKREAYAAIGGHEAIRSNPVDDVELGRATKRIGLRWMLFEGADTVQVLPYRGNIDAFRGVSRSVFPALYYSLALLALGSAVLLAVAFLPLVTLLLCLIFYPHKTVILAIAMASIIMIAFPWLIVCSKFHHNRLSVLLYPISIALVVLGGFHSMVTYRFAITKWKGRKLIDQHFRLP